MSGRERLMQDWLRQSSGGRGYTAVRMNAMTNVHGVSRRPVTAPRYIDSVRVRRDRLDAFRMVCACVAVMHVRNQRFDGEQAEAQRQERRCSASDDEA